MSALLMDLFCLMMEEGLHMSAGTDFLSGGSSFETAALLSKNALASVR